MLVLLAIFSLQFSSVQTYLTQKVASYLSKELNSDISLDRIYFKPFSSLELSGFSMKDLHGEDIFTAQHLSANFVLSYIFINRLTINEIKLEGAHVNLHIYRDSTNFSTLTRYFSASPSGSQTEKKKLRLDLKRIELINNRFKLVNHKFNHHNRGVDFSDLDITEISGIFENMHLDSTVQAEIQDFTLKEKSGLYIRELRTKAFYSDKKMEFQEMYLATNNSIVQDYLRFDYKSMKDFGDFIRKVHVTGGLKDSYVDSHDIEFFAPTMKYVVFETAIKSGNISGTVSDIKAQNIHLTTANQTALIGDFTIKGLPYIHKTIFDFDLRKLQTSPKDVEILVPKFANRASFALPKEMHTLEQVSFSGKFRGLYNDFYVDGKINTPLGKLATKSQINIQKSLSYKGKVQSDLFNVGKFLDRNIIGSSGIDLRFDGYGLTFKDLKLEANGTLTNSQIHGYSYDNIALQGRIAQQILEVNGTIDDDNLKMVYNTVIDWNSSTPNYLLDADIGYAQFNNLKWLKKDSVTLLGAKINTNLMGNALNNVTGHFDADSVQLSTTKGKFNINKVNFTATGDQENRILFLNSDIADAKMYGNIDLNTIGAYFTSLAMRYAPAIDLVVKPYNRQNFDLEINIKSFRPIASLLDPSLSLDAGSHLKASFSTDKYTANFIAYSPKMEYKGMRFTNLAIEENADDKAFSLDINADRLNFGDSLYVNHIYVRNTLANDRLNFNIIMSKKNATNYLDLKGNIHFAHNAPAYIEFDPSTIIINREHWNLNSDATMRISKGKVYLSNLILNQGQQQVKLNGVMSNENDNLYVEFHQFGLSSLNGITNPLGIHLRGAMNGRIDISSMFKKPFASADIQTSSIIYNQIPIGQLNLVADFDPLTGLANIALRLADDDKRGIELAGSYNFFDENERLNIEGELQETDLTIFEPFLKNLISDLRGKASGNVNINGTFKNPKISGVGRIHHAAFTVNYLQTHYHIENQSTLVENNAIILQNIKINDPKGHVATANGIINLAKIASPYIDVDISTDNVMILNTTYRDNNLYYGTAYASGTFRFKGYTSAIDINIDARSESNTVITIPFNSAMTISDSDFIYFVSRDSIENEKQERKSLFKGLTMNMNITITPEAEVNLPTNLGTLKGNGQGEIDMKITSLGDFEMFGDYRVIDGKFHFTAQDFINKYFDIKEGGTIRWTGNPSEAVINLNAIYQQRTAAGPLYNAAGRAGEDERVLAQADMLIKGTLEQPDITFDLNFPQNPYIKDQLQSYLSDANNVNQQALSLIVRRSFTPSSTNEIGREVNNTLLSAGTEIAFNQLNNIISQSLNINFFDLNIRSFNDASASVRLLNDRLVLTGGITDRTNYQATDLTFFREGITTDAELTYRLRQDGNLMVRAYNRPYTRNFLIRMNDAEYISAVGLVYRQEFNSIREFWQKLWIWDHRKKKM